MTAQQLHPIQREGRHRSRRRGVAAAIVLALVLLGWLATRDEPKGSPAHLRRSPAAAQPPRSSSASGGTSVTWSDLGGLAVPVSATAGPHRQVGARAAGFEHNTTGAAFAAVNLLVRTFPFAGSAIFGPTIEDQADGPDAPALARLTADAYSPLAAAAGVKDGRPVRSEGGWVAGYRLDPPTGPTPGPDPAADRRTVRVLIRQVEEAGAVGFTEYRVQLTWRDGDWRIVAPAWGDWRSNAVALSEADPARYVSYDSGRA